jgi:hypothetical protein
MFIFVSRSIIAPMAEASDCGYILSQKQYLNLGTVSAREMAVLRRFRENKREDERLAKEDC